MQKSTLTLIFFTLVLTALEYFIFQKKVNRTIKKQSGYRKYVLSVILFFVSAIVNCGVVAALMTFNLSAIWGFIKHPYIEPRRCHYIFCVPLLIVLGALYYIVNGIRNGVFYAKGNNSVTDRFIISVRKNIHRVMLVSNTVVYLAWTIGFFALFRLLEVKYSLLHAPVFAFVTIFCITSFGYQKWINLGSGLPVIDPNESKTSEWFILPNKKPILVPRTTSKRDRIINYICAPGIVVYLLILLF